MNRLHGAKALVVDAAEAEQQLLTSYLEKQGCRVWHARDGLDGIHKARLIEPDLVILDIDLPGCDGLSVCRILSADAATRHAPVVFVSASSAPQTRVLAFLAGAADFLAKPFEVEELRLRLLVHLGYRAHMRRGGVPPPDAELPAAPGPRGRLNDTLFHSARIHLLRSLDNPPGTQELAQRVGTNTKRLNDAFRAAAGCTVGEYVRRERMHEARQLLCNTQYSVTAIADKVGFSSSANFATAFRECFGVTPSEFRAKYGHTLLGA